ncbi:glycosyltransferase family 4 protein [Candidatus Nitrosocosmicus hydrocola]|uniref:glycosyltransferase family 4 protein n=1 Tax=Candidatus Nitrosocosmicus hydrocola TaxID=1826872 RepID=UPI0011E598A9|nr:glycosyltransferase family 4 protein [Candidatus Nitrosocosmicus hydrocola]
MNILHVWDQSGVACILAKNQNKLGHNAKVIRRANYDPYSIYEFYNELVEFVDETNYLDFCLKEAKSADIVHIHSRTDALLYLKKKLENKTKIIMHFHGTDLRGIKRKYTINEMVASPKLLFKNIRVARIRQRNNLLAEEFADKVLYSTPDLRKFLKVSDPILVHIPIDTDHFTRSKNIQAKEDFFIFNTQAISNMKWIVNYCKIHGINKLNIIDRIRQPIKYSEMPLFLKQYKTYVDVRYVNDELLPNLSTTALQSLACGLDVLDYNLNRITELPSDRAGSNATKIVQKIYEEIQ